MKGTDKKFEDLFREAFENAELTPSSEVWKRIERELAKKPRVIAMPILKQIAVAAAVILFTLGTSYFAYRSFLKPSNPVTIESTVTPPSAGTNPRSETADKQLRQSPSVEEIRENVADKSDVRSHSVVSVRQADKGFLAGTARPNPKKRNLPFVGNGEQSEFILLPALSFLELPVVKDYFRGIQAPEKATLVSVSSSEEELPEKSSVATRRGWAGLVVSGNSFNPGFSRVSNMQPTPFIVGQYAEASVIHNDLTDSLFNKNSVSLQIDGGYFIGRKWAIRSGLAFVRNSYSINSSAELILPPFLQGSAAKANSIEVNMQMLSVPLQLAYVSEGKFGYQISAGIAGDLTLSHNISSRRVEGVEYTFGNYKPFNISGLAGVGLFYNITPHVGIHLDANYRRSLNSVYQSPHLRANPQWISLGGGLLYKF